MNRSIRIVAGVCRKLLFCIFSPLATRHSPLLLAFVYLLLAGCFCTARAEEGPRVQPNGDALFMVRGDYRGSEAAARDNVLQAAQLRIRDWLQSRDPPVQHFPSLEEIRKYMVTNEGIVSTQEIPPNELQYKMELMLTVTPEEVRKLLSKDRVYGTAWSFAGLMVVLGVAAVVLRLDEWSKGYLTKWLLYAGAAAMGGLLALWWWAR